MSKIVVPGEVVTAERKQLGDNVYVSRGKIFSTTVGIVRDQGRYASVVALNGGYVPRRGDVVVGVVTREEYSGYIVAINSTFQSFVLKDDFIRPQKPGSIVSARVASVDEMHEAKLEDVRPLMGGTLLTVTPVKVPRVIGRHASMLETLKRGTGCSLVIGRNGWAWVRGGNTKLLQTALSKIEAESHTHNLTHKIEQLLQQERPKHTATA